MSSPNHQTYELCKQVSGFEHIITLSNSTDSPSTCCTFVAPVQVFVSPAHTSPMSINMWWFMAPKLGSSGHSPDPLPLDHGGPLHDRGAADDACEAAFRACRVGARFIEEEGDRVTNPVNRKRVVVEILDPRSTDQFTASGLTWLEGRQKTHKPTEVFHRPPRRDRRGVPDRSVHQELNGAALLPGGERRAVCGVWRLGNRASPALVD